jgi:hypothetical protein
MYIRVHGVGVAAERDRPMRIRLIRKPALCLNGIDVSDVRVGDIVDLPDRAARLLLLEGWAERTPDDPPHRAAESSSFSTT